MTNKIYQMKDDDNWFIGKWNGYNSIELLGGVLDEDLNSLNQMLAPLNNQDYDEENWQEFGYAITVIEKNSDYKLVSFVLNMINEETGRHLVAIEEAGAIIILEDETIYAIKVPRQGVSKQSFFGKSTQSFGDTILIATHNQGKTKEFRQLFGKIGYKVEDLSNYPELPEVEETGVTFEENARLKAETIANLTGKMVLADDSGLKVDILGGLPGVWSARFSGPEATDLSNNAKLLHELAMVFEKKDRSAQFHTTLVVAAPGKDSLVVEADWLGYIATEPKGQEGFGYDPLFIVGESDKHAAELSAEEKNEISHRGQAVKKLMEVFPSWQAKLS
ncbi:nucleoside-triphosphate diphosphatase [Streptococcus parauberis]|uniref:dITP/XTP pyrophosphatase n=1 Tax=Streptococcus parauberis TaxID=1348 RepID=A0AAE4KZV0_9STRE|nr:nucleoside-triphosphate diphosphatase [Streptococcus parauberis]MDT2730680.1 nucleoside-triphosphate diphosphatase [Streptococcus parauberis]